MQWGMNHKNATGDMKERYLIFDTNYANHNFPLME